MNAETEGTNPKIETRRSLKCDACGATDWTVAQGGRHALLRIETNDSIDVRAVQALAVLPLVCNNCGLVRLFDANLIQDH